jgi:hypothetical protein
MRFRAILLWLVMAIGLTSRGLPVQISLYDFSPFQNFHLARVSHYDLHQGTVFISDGKGITVKRDYNHFEFEKQ